MWYTNLSDTFACIFRSVNFCFKVFINLYKKLPTSDRALYIIAEPINVVVIKITNPLIVIGLKKPFSTNSLAKLFLDSLLSNNSITLKVVV